MKSPNILFILLAFVASWSAQAQTSGNQRQLFVDGLCGMCEERIEKAALSTSGVRSASWDMDSRQLTVEVDPDRFKEDRLHRNIAAVGHDTEKAKASDEVYANLHECCKYRDEEQSQESQAPVSIAVSENVSSFFVDGVCGDCKLRIETTAKLTSGVNRAVWDLDSRRLVVEFDPKRFEIDRLHRNLANVGHDTEKMKASETAYLRLDDCCRYRELNQEIGSTVSGAVFQQQVGGQEPLVGVNLFWVGSDKGTASDAAGQFSLERIPETSLLVVSYVGFQPDTLDVSEMNEVEIMLSEAVLLDQVQVTYRRKPTELSFIDPIKVLQISESELTKAACCNLSESFETNPSVDVSFTDAVTGTRQIEMLGLAGPYVQLTRENMPDIRGLSAIYGLTYIPGPWIEGIQLIKGPGSVVNGFESIAGQINVELRKPEDSDKLYLNLYANEAGRVEANANWRHNLSPTLHTGLLLHGRTLQTKMDNNHDGFLDNPLDQQFIVVNRWKFDGTNGLSGQFGFRGAYIDNQSGQKAFDPERDRNSTSYWGAGINTRRAEAWAKIGKVFPNRPNSSIGLQLSALVHDQDAYFGLRNYDASQRMAYANLIYQGILGTTTHQFRTGLSFQWDQFDETLVDQEFRRNEWAPGAYFEYTYKPAEQFDLVAGLRADYHNQFGLFFTPRLHLRYALDERTVLRAQVGRGQRTATIIAENIGALASSRNLIVHSQNPNTPYGLDAEVAWNFGINYTQNLVLGPREVVLSLDAYHTRFENQIVVDFDRSPRELHFYNLDGRSFTNSLQAQLDYELIPRFDLRLAYRFNDVRTTFGETLLEKPLISRHRAFVNMAYETQNTWKFDLTLNWQGSKRIPSTAANPEDHRLPERSPDFLVVNTQISKVWKGNLEIYLGAENLLDFRQANPILAAHNPFSPLFDGSLVWGPIFGRMLYTGFRYRLK